MPDPCLDMRSRGDASELYLVEDASVVGRDIMGVEEKTLLYCSVYCVSYMSKFRVSNAIMLTPFEACDWS